MPNPIGAVNFAKKDVCSLDGNYSSKINVDSQIHCTYDNNV